MNRFPVTFIKLKLKYFLKIYEFEAKKLLLKKKKNIPMLQIFQKFTKISQGLPSGFPFRTSSKIQLVFYPDFLIISYRIVVQDFLKISTRNLSKNNFFNYFGDSMTLKNFPGILPEIQKSVNEIFRKSRRYIQIKF